MHMYMRIGGGKKKKILSPQSYNFRSNVRAQNQWSDQIQ